ncbi:MAG: AbgT family transporter [Verrucomicrobiota bacterium]
MKLQDQLKRIVSLLGRAENIGNRLPDPLTIFVILTACVALASWLFAGVSAEVVQRDGTVANKVVTSLFSMEGIRWALLSAIDNFIGFAPLGPVLVIMIGIGVAERTGLIATGLQILVGKAPASMLPGAVVFAGVLSSMAADAGYVVLTPLGALLFAGFGRHPIAGLAAAYAGVSGGYSANLLITGLDPLLAGITGQAAQIIDPSYSVTAVSNYYFILASTFLVTAIGTWVTVKIVEPMLGEWMPPDNLDLANQAQEIAPEESRAFWISLSLGALFLLISFSLAIPGGPLHDETAPGQPGIDALGSFFSSIEILITFIFIVPGIVFGVLTKRIRNDKDVAKLAADSMASMGAYLVLAFIAGQFVAWFNYTQVGSITAVKGAMGLEAIGLTGIPLLLAFLLVAAAMNVFVGSASAKWAFMAPIFVPMLMQMGIAPEATQAAYRVGDSVTNIITPLMPYLPIIIVFAQRYQPDAGLGTIIASMLPYSFAFLIAWTLLLIAWLSLGIPLGPGAETWYEINPETVSSP